MTGQTVGIAPSLLSADFSKLGQEIAVVEGGGADWLHLDVMDAHFVPNLTFGPPVIRSLRKTTGMFFDAHLMMTDPHKYLEDYAKAGCNGVTIHIEAYPDPRDVLQQIRDLGMKAGLSINPPTGFAAAEPYLGHVDTLLVMSVNPGFGGQSFMSEVLSKVEWARDLKRAQSLDFVLEIDGGIDPETAPHAVQAGAEMLVAGSAVFGKPDPAQAVSAIRSAGLAALSSA